MDPGLMFTLELGVNGKGSGIGSLSATNAPRMRSLLSARRPGSGAARTQALAPEHQVPEERARYALTFLGLPLPTANAVCGGASGGGDLSCPGLRIRRLCMYVL